MLFYGKNIRTAGDQLYPIDVKRVFAGITKPKPELKTQIERLRMLQTVDLAGYKQFKTQLPYLVCGSFNPPIRKTENFAAIQCFFLDIDHVTEAEMDIMQLKIKLSQDNRVALMFVSPGGNGLKLLFNLKEKIFDAGKFSMIYKLFARNFAKLHGIETLIDIRTFDVTRACFMSVDNEAYMNENPELVAADELLNFENALEVKEAQSEISFQQKLFDGKPVEKNTEVSKEIIEQIRLTLNPKLQTKKEKIMVVPEQLDDIEAKIRKIAELNKLEIPEVTNINYGRKFKFAVGFVWAELNVFFGKKGITLVKSAKTGADLALTDTVYLLMFQELCTLKE